MRKSFKKIVAVAMAATMVLGSSVVAFADGNPASGSGTADGTGSSNGHLEQKVVSVTLPTSVGTTFDYIADPEDLVGKTKDTNNKGKTKTGTEVLANSDYIYFHNAAITADADKDIAAQTEGYSSTSDTVRVTNKSSADIKLTVEATVEDNDNNMAIADAAADLATATTTPTVHFDLLTKAKGATAATSTAVTTADGVSKAKAAFGRDKLERELSNHILGVARPQDIANVVAFLLSDAACKITGQNIFVESGCTLGYK